MGRSGDLGPPEARRLPLSVRMVAPIVTVTPSPALDRTLRVDRLDFGGIARVRDVREDPGGKGINVSRVLNHFGYPTRALGFIGGRIGTRLEEELRRSGIVTDFIPLEGETFILLSRLCCFIFWGKVNATPGAESVNKKTRISTLPIYRIHVV